MIAVGVDGEHPGVGVVLTGELLAELANGQRLAAHINAGVVEEQLVHHLLAYQATLESGAVSPVPMTSTLSAFSFMPWMSSSVTASMEGASTK